MREFKPEIVHPQKRWPVVVATIAAIVIGAIVLRATEPPPVLDYEPLDAGVDATDLLRISR